MRVFVTIFFYILLLLLGLQPSFAQQSPYSVEQTFIDSIITTKITLKIAKDAHVNPFKVTASTQNGVVTLRGHANDRKAYVAILRAAKNTDGVQRIIASGLDIESVNSGFTDAYITAKVEAAVLRAKVLDDESIPLAGINAKTVNGVVTLEGQVKTLKAKLAIIERINKVRGIKKIISHLDVENTS